MNRLRTGRLRKCRGSRRRRGSQGHRTGRPWRKRNAEIGQVGFDLCSPRVKGFKFRIALFEHSAAGLHGLAELLGFRLKFLQKRLTSLLDVGLDFVDFELVSGSWVRIVNEAASALLLPFDQGLELIGPKPEIARTFWRVISAAVSMP